MSRTADIPPKQVTSSLVVPHKRARSNTFGIVLFDTAIMTEHSRSAADVAPDPAWTLPAPTRHYITLYITLPRLEVWRVVEVPMNYSFALLHTLLQFLFGWSNSHLHQFAVYDGITISRTCKGEIEEAGRVLQRDIKLLESLQPDHSEMHMGRIKGEDPIWRVGLSSESSRSKGEDNWVIEKDEQFVTLGDVWNQEEGQNLSYMTDGQSSNEQIAIKYEYDFNASWIVHISCHTENPFVSKVEPSNLPRIVKAQGAPPMEDVSYSEPLEEVPKKKRLPPVFYSADVFAKYAAQKVHSVTVEESLAVYTSDEAQAWSEERRRLEEEREKEHYGEIEDADEADETDETDED